MNTITLTATVQPDHELHLTIPEEFPVGAVITISVQTEITSLEEARAILAAAGKLADDSDIDEDDIATEDATDEELEEIGQLAPGAPSILSLIREDRGEY